MALLQVHRDPDVFNIKIPLTGNPLRDLNVYVIESEGEALVIDTGFRTEECREGLLAGLRELAVPMERIRLFITHMHSDHAGQTDLFAKAGCPVYMGKKDIPWLRYSITGQGRAFLDRRYLENGYPKEVLERSHGRNPMFAYAPLEEIEVVPLADGERIKIGGVTAACVDTGGHTPGHCCLYLEEAGILFFGDHVLYDITPNIGVWSGVEDSLGMYLESLRRVDALGFTIGFPAHRERHEDPHGRIRELFAHHKSRLKEVMAILSGEPGLFGL